MVNYYGYVMR